MRRIIITSVLSATALMLAFAALQNTNSAARAECIPVFNGVQSQVCESPKAEQDLGWAQWAQFKSKSVQLHFLDLVELVFGAEPQRAVQRNAIDEQSKLLP